MVPFTKNPEKYLVYTVSDIQDIITKDLFDARAEFEGANPAQIPLGSLTSLKSVIQGAINSLE